MRRFHVLVHLHRLWLTAVSALLLTAVACRAEDGVTDDAVVVTRVISMSGPAGAKAREQEDALRAYFGAINAGGGVNGRRIVLRTTDLDLQNERELDRICAADTPFALFLFGGTVGSIVGMNHASAHQVPFVAPNSGASIFRKQFNRYLFNVRAGYQDEIAALTRYAATISLRRIALVHVDDSFGRDAADGYQDAVRASGIASVLTEKFASSGDDLPRLVAALAHASPDMVIAVGASKRVADIINRSRDAGVKATFATLSNNASTGFAVELGERARGVIVSQVTPPGSGAKPLGRELRRLMKVPPDTAVSYAALEAYASAKVLVEGLQRSGPTLTRKAFVRSLESMRRFDLGGLEVDYSTTSRNGSGFVDLSILSSNGKYQR